MSPQQKIGNVAELLELLSQFSIPVPPPIPRTDTMRLLILGMTFYVAKRGASEQA